VHPAHIPLQRLDLVSFELIFCLNLFQFSNCFVSSVEWSQKAKRRRTTGTGRMQHLKVVARRYKNGFREGFFLYLKVVVLNFNLTFLFAGTTAKSQKKTPAAV